jgi:putative hemolysin
METSAVPLSVLILMLRPVITLLRWVNKPFEKKGSPAHGAAVDEIVALAGHAQLDNQISTQQADIITGVTLLGRKTAKDLMIPVEQITFLSTAHTLTDAIITAHLDPHTRFPVMEGDDRNTILGYVNFKELVYRMRTNPADPTLRGIIRQLRFIHEDAPCQHLIKAFVDEHEHIAMVQNAEKQTVGLITLEDIVEELVGELGDEFDTLPKMLHPLSKGVWIVGGGISMQTLANKLNVPSVTSGETLSQWMLQRLGQTPAIDNRIRTDGLEFNIRRLRRGKIFEVLITPDTISAPRR